MPPALTFPVSLLLYFLDLLSGTFIPAPHIAARPFGRFGAADLSDEPKLQL